jgi:hypothetical protein
MVPNANNAFESEKDSVHVLGLSASNQESSESPFTLENQAEASRRSSISTINSSIIQSSVPPEPDFGSDSLTTIRQQLHKSTVPEFLLHLPTMLVEYYFNYVCRIFSSFDGNLNPFRSTVGKLWDGSAPIYYAIQSMAAAYLANDFPRMSPVGVQMQRETYQHLYQIQRGVHHSENLDRTLLTLLLIGQTTAWHDPKDLGLVHLKTAKQLQNRRMEQQISQIVGMTDNRNERQNAFFEQCILYWDMLAGFVVDDVDEYGLAEFESIDPIALHNADISASSDDKKNIFPHPWTGVAPKVQRLFAQTGRLIRSYRKTVAEDAANFSFLFSDFGLDLQHPQDSIVTIEALSKAQSLEADLLAFELPLVSSLVDAGDENTPAQHYLDLAEAYRCAGLLQIYRLFPSILLRHIPRSNDTFASSSSTDDLTEHIFSFLPLPPPQRADEFLVSLALHTISLLEKLPPNSGTRCLQPIVIIAAASELRFTSDTTVDLTPLITASTAFNGITTGEVDVASARRFVVTRLQEFQLSLPAKPIMKALQLIQETWARADLGLNVYWMDIMDEMGLASIFG